MALSKVNTVFFPIDFLFVCLFFFMMYTICVVIVLPSKRTSDKEKNKTTSSCYKSYYLFIFQPTSYCSGIIRIRLFWTYPILLLICVYLPKQYQSSYRFLIIKRIYLLFQVLGNKTNCFSFGYIKD